MEDEHALEWSGGPIRPRTGAGAAARATDSCHWGARIQEEPGYRSLSRTHFSSGPWLCRLMKDMLLKSEKQEEQGG